MDVVPAGGSSIRSRRKRKEFPKEIEPLESAGKEIPDTIAASLDEDSTPKRKRSQAPKEYTGEGKISQIAPALWLHQPLLPQSDSPLCIIPQEVLFHLLSFLDIKALGRLLQTCKQLSLLSQDGVLWKQLAHNLFGEMIDKVEYEANWHQYIMQRSSSHVASEISPVNLIQEKYCREPWKLLISVILIQRTKGGKQILDVIDSFFQQYPNPSAVASGSTKEMCMMIDPLGLQQQRAKAAKNFSWQFMTKEWQEPKELFGVGDLGNDSWHIFCHGRYKSKTKDASLKLFVAWAKKK